MDVLAHYPLLLAVAIFLARILDVSLSTVRTIMVIRGYRLLAALTGFWEVLIWLAAAGQVLANLDAWYLALAYAAGFATGNMVGMWLEAKLAMGLELVRAVSADLQVPLGNRLRTQGYSVVTMDGTGDQGVPVEVLLLVERRRRVPALLAQIQDLDPEAICTLNDVKGVRRTARSPRRRGLVPGGLFNRTSRK
jgi:uncharacterized protein YebE (UPF0316 family)